MDTFNGKDTKIHVFKNEYINDDFVTSPGKSSRKYVSFTNKKTGEQVPDYLNRLSESFAPVHSQFISLKTNMVYGNGIKPNLENPIVASRLEEFKAILNNIDGQGTNINKQFRKFATNVPVHEAVVFYVVYNRLGQPRFIHYLPTASYRAGDYEDILGEPDSYFISRDWACGRPRYKEYPRYNPKAPGDGVQILVSRYDSLANWYYNIPKWTSGLKSINVISELQKMYLNSVNNGMHGSGIFTTIGTTTDPKEFDKKEAYLRKNLTGAESAGKTLYFEVNSLENAPTYQAISPALNHQVFYELNTQANQAIITAHGGHAELAGIDMAGVDLGGDANKLIASYIQYKNSVTDGLQDLIVVDGYNRIFKDMGWGDNAVYAEDRPFSELTLADGVTDKIEQDGFDSNRSSLSGKQNIQLKRIKREYKNGTINEAEAVIALRDFGYDDAKAKEILAAVTSGADKIDEETI